MNRRIALDGTVNLRDLGGYETEGGRRVRWGRLFRSDSLADLSDADLERLGALGLRTVCDLRDPQERDTRPNRALGDAVRVHEIPVLPSSVKGVWVGVGSMEVAAIEAWLADLFRSMALEHRPQYARVLDVLLEPGALPAIIHCTSGRDRTGFAAMIVLAALGVPRATIVEDYLLSDIAHRDIEFLIGTGVDEAKVAAMTTPRAEYVLAGFAAMEEAFGSVDGYLRDAVGLDDERRRRLQELLLEN